LLAGFALVWQADRVSAQGIIWNESVNGSLSNDGNSPTSLGSLALGSNTVIGTSEVVGATSTGDFFTISIPESQITSLLLNRDRQLFVLIGYTGYTNALGYSFNSLTGDLMTQFQLPPIGSGL
jgi:hypothetical protein